jgi:hypothetical protein
MQACLLLYLLHYLKLYLLLYLKQKSRLDDTITLSIRQHASACVSAYVSMRQHATIQLLSAYVSMLRRMLRVKHDTITLSIRQLRRDIGAHELIHHAAYLC